MTHELDVGGHAKCYGRIRVLVDCGVNPDAADVSRHGRPGPDRWLSISPPSLWSMGRSQDAARRYCRADVTHAELARRIRVLRGV